MAPLRMDVKSYFHVPSKRIMPYRLRRFVSPLEFYLEFDSLCGLTPYQTWFADMQNHFQSESHPTLLSKNESPSVGYCYACFNPDDGKWHRVRVYSMKKGRPDEGDTVNVFYLDLIEAKTTTSQYLYHLPPKFEEPLVQVFRCYLYDILPLDVTGDDQREVPAWTPDACKFLEDQMKDRAFSGLLMLGTREYLKENDDDKSDEIFNYGVILVENQPDSRFPRGDVCTLNAQMVDAGYAVATGVCAGCMHTTEIEPYTMSESPFMKDWKQLQAQSTQSEVETVQALAARLANLSAEMEAHGQDPLGFYQKTTRFFPKEFKERMAEIDIVNADSPSCMFVHLSSHTAALESMRDSLGAKVEGQDKMEEIKDGQFVACYLPHSSNDDTKPSYWARGIVQCAGTEPNTYEVLLTDYGMVAPVSDEHIRALPKDFEWIPSFATRVHLDELGLVPFGNKMGLGDYSYWNMDEIKHFLPDNLPGIEKSGDAPYVDTTPATYYAHRQGQVIELDQFEQELIFKFRQFRWAAIPLKDDLKPFAVIDKFKEHPMVRSLYHSIGMYIAFEIVAPGVNMWIFKPLSVDLVSRRFAMMVGDRTKMGLHMKFVDDAQCALLAGFKK